MQISAQAEKPTRKNTPGVNVKKLVSFVTDDEAK
jgi:hypothetical protein